MKRVSPVCGYLHSGIKSKVGDFMLFVNFHLTRAMTNGDQIFFALTKSKTFHEQVLAFHSASGIKIELVTPSEVTTDFCEGNVSFSDLNNPKQSYRANVAVRHGGNIIAVVCTEPLIEPDAGFHFAPQFEAKEFAELATATNRIFPRCQLQKFIPILLLFTEHLSTIANQALLATTGCEPTAVIKAKQYLQSHRKDPFNLVDIAEHAHASRFHLCKLFKKVTGLSLTQYLALLRIESAKRLVCDARLRISEVAFEVGFQSLAHFHRSFKATVGASPREYRKTLHRAFNSKGKHNELTGSEYDEQGNFNK